MDCERLDRIVLDLVYDELDELTAASARRHLDQCARCRGIVSGLRATREVGTLPLVDPPEGLELRILEAERRVREGLPLRQRVGRAISMLAGYAMRPQVAMAAIFLLAIGSSLIFFHARPGDRNSMSVTERGVPESDNDSIATQPAATVAAKELDRLRPLEAPEARREAAATPAAPAPALASASSLEAEGDTAYQAALGAFRDGRYAEARQQFEGVAARGGPEASEAALYAAQSAKNAQGCAEAARLFDNVPFRYPGTRPGYDATWQAAACYESMGDVEKARRNYQALLDEPSYAERAKSALAQLDRTDPPVEVAARKPSAPQREANDPLVASEVANTGSGAPATHTARPGSAARPAAKAAPKQAAAASSSNQQLDKKQRPAGSKQDAAF